MTAFVQNFELLRRIKQLSYQSKMLWEQSHPGQKSLSTSKIYAACTKPFDADAAALKAASNPNHEHFGKPVEEIKNIWNAKREQGAHRGNSIDDYIKSVIVGQQFDLSNAEELFVQKAAGVDKFFKDVNNRLGEFIGDEVWLFDLANGINVRSDGLFINGKNVYICEWKNITNFKTNNVKSQCFGPLLGYDDCDLIKVNIQVYTYKNILESYFGDEFNFIPMIVNFIPNDYQIQPTLLTNYKTLLPELASYARTAQQ